MLSDFDKAARFGTEAYRNELMEKVQILEYLIENWDDGRKKSFYCLAVNLLPLSVLKSIIHRFETEYPDLVLEKKEKARAAAQLYETVAGESGVELKLRK